MGIHSLPVDTHNGDQITVEDKVSDTTDPKICVVSLLHLVGSLHKRRQNTGLQYPAVMALSLPRAMQDFVVTSLVLQYKLVAGRYQREHNKLEVQQTNRYLMNLYYDSLLDRS